MSRKPLCIISIDVEESCTSSQKQNQSERIIFVNNESLHEVQPPYHDTTYISDNTSQTSVLEIASISPNDIYQLKNGDHSFMTLDGKVFSAFIYLLTINDRFRMSYISKNSHELKSINLSFMKVKLVMPEKCEIGYNSQSLALHTLWERIELEDAMHWLSTLGGAYSNLGEHSMSFAHRACDNAIRQMKIALKSDDPFVIYRCWLYIAMSLMQQGKLSKSRKIIEMVYRNFSTLDKMNRRTEDDKILKMCLGIWARLMHVWNSRKRKMA